MKYSDLVFTTDMYTRSQWIITDDCIFRITYWSGANEYWHKEYEAQVSYYKDFWNMVNMWKKYNDHPISIIEEKVKIAYDELWYKDILIWIQGWAISPIILRGIAIQSNTLYDFSKKELENFLKDINYNEKTKT